MKNFREKLAKITTFIFDFDGVLSDGKIWVLPDGEQVRATGVKDGYALQYALRQGYNVAIISGGIAESMRLRYKSFTGIDVYLRVHNKVEVLEEYMAKKNITADEIMVMGDDIPDYNIMKMAAVSCCPADAAEEIKSIADYISDKNGGCGCARDIIEQTLKLQGKWLQENAFFW